MATREQIVDRLLDENSNQALKASESVTNVGEAGNLFDDLEFDDGLDNDADWRADEEAEGDEEEISNDTVRESLAADRLSARVQKYFDFLKSREQLFGDAYPFEVGEKSIVQRSPVFSPSQYLYIVLLCSSLLRFATRSGVNKMGHHFEVLCGPVFKRLVPRGTTVKFFGSGDSSVDGFRGTFYEKVETLASFLHVHLGHDFTPCTQSNHDVGDGGLDWVGYYDFGDSQKFQPKFFAQCACGSNWVGKQFDAHFDKWTRFLDLDNVYLLYHFIPRSLRSAEGKFSRPTDIYKVTMLDRRRIIELLKEDRALGTFLYDTYMDFFDELHSKKLDLFA